MKRFFLIFALAMFFASCAKVEVGDLRTEQMLDPMNIQTQHPRLSWVITSEKQDVMQTAYHILVATNPELLREGKADVWDSKRVESDQSIWVPYNGVTLKSNQRLYWCVKVYTTQGESAWSQPAQWGMGLMDDSEWQAQWIGCDTLLSGEMQGKDDYIVAARYLRKEFNLSDKEVQQAVVHISGLGTYELYLNGQRVGDAALAPAPTDWRQTVLYDSYDVTDLLARDNAIGVALGSGRYVTLRIEDTVGQPDMFGLPKLRLQLVVTFTDGSEQTIVSDGSWSFTAEGPVRKNNEYDGGIYDARMELGNWTSTGYSDSRWSAAQCVAAPGGSMKGSTSERMVARDSVVALTVSKTDRGTYIVDFGQNIAGWALVKWHGLKAGDSVTMRFAEILDSTNNALYLDNLRSAKATDIYVANGNENGEFWHMPFLTHGFRFMEISGLNEEPKVDDFVSVLIFDDLASTSTFETSNDILNQVYKNAWWGIADNYKGMPLDCCQRDERMPWLGDRTVGCYGESFLFANGNLYAKWMRDICQAQDTAGNIPNVCPTFWRISSPNMTWPAALPMGCDMLYRQFGNLEPMRESYDHIVRWLDYMIKTHRDGTDFLIAKDTWGDWCMPPEAQELIHSKDPSRITDGGLMSSAYYVKVCRLLAEYAPLVGHSSDVERWQRTADTMTEAFNHRYLVVHQTADSTIDSVYYGNNTVTANVLPLAFGMVPEQYVDQVRRSIINKIVNDNGSHVSCGVIGMSWIQRELSRMGQGSLAYRLASNTTWPSYGYMIAHGATTIWELWNGNTANPAMNSGNHVMLLGDLLQWFFKDLGGIQNEQPAYKVIRFCPDFSIEGLEYVKTSYRSLYGTIVSSYRHDGGRVVWDIEVPCNTQAIVCLPDGDRQVGSGKHHFEF
ncbi:MAG: family 78 glycoside hydrolase catalytic domain [Bacteroidales bacterium]|nr:family 78 glycoside hydrolase catalytic domain [Candidatus Colimorpha onthohippi]